MSVSSSTSSVGGVGATDETDHDAGHGPDFVQSLERGLAVIRAFGPDTPQLTLSEVARATGLTRAAARRFLLTLAELGYVRADGRAFSLRPRILELGFAYLSGLSLPETAQPHMEELVAKVHESCSVSVLDGDDVVYVARVPTRRIMSVTIAVGTRFPAYATSMGRVLLAGLPPAALDHYVTNVDMEPLTRRTLTTPDRLLAVLHTVRTQGYAMVDQELEDGLRSIAVPIRGGGDEVIAAINVSSHASRATLDTLRREYLPLLRATAEQIEADLRVTGHPIFR
jgi:IclR family transcriptional regulator, pca regulon regulatory protein